MFLVMADSNSYVLLFQDDFKRIRDWVLQYPDRETGGQFFGLWTHNKNPYINIVIGPGQACRHETHSFHQDIDYLKDAGSFLNGEFMLCHIGEWHSHHRLGLRQPSSGDLNSIWKHFPSGVERFLLVIATIESNDVKLWPWLFTASNHTYTGISVRIVKNDNVFMKDEVVQNRIAVRAEVNMTTITKPLPVQAEEKESWFLSDKGAIFVQVLNSELEKLVIDESSTIDKTCNIMKSTLQFSFTRNGCKCILYFPDNFPKNDLTVVCIPPDCTNPMNWTEKIASGQFEPQFAHELAKKLRDLVPTIN